MKNLIKKKMIKAMENWPSRKPCVKESLWMFSGVYMGTSSYLRRR